MTDEQYWSIVVMFAAVTFMLGSMTVKLSSIRKLLRELNNKKG